MPDFMIATNWNQPEVNLNPFVPYQPLTPGLQITRRTFTPNGVKDEGPFIRFTWGMVNETQFQAMLSQWGLLTELEGPVTLYAQDLNYNWTRLNGTAIRPLNEGRRGFFLPNVPLLVKNIHAVT